MGNLRNTSTVLFLFLLCWSVPSISEGVPVDVPYLEIDCLIKDQNVLGVINGKPQKYPGVDDSYGVGDLVKITILSTEPPPIGLVVDMKWKGKRELFTAFRFDQSPLEILSYNKGGMVAGAYSYLYFDENEITVEGGFRAFDINLRRYYKSDYDGFIVEGSHPRKLPMIDEIKSKNPPMVVVNSVDCRTKTNNLMDLLQYGKLKTE
jgi:hypothetical protein